MAKRAAAIAALMCAAFVASASAGSSTQSARLLQAGRLQFPFSAKCFKNGQGSPYLLSGPQPSVVGDVLQINLTVVANTAAALKSCPNCPNCYQGIVNNLQRIEIRSGVRCAFVDVLKGVYINGQLKTEGVAWGFVPGQPDAVLRLTDLNLKSDAIGTKIAIVLGAPCNMPGMFTGPRGGKLMYFMSNTTQHECCPINTWDWGKSWAQTGPVGTAGAVGVKVILSKLWFSASDVKYNAGKVEAAFRAVAEAAGTLADLTGVTITPDTVGTDFGYDVRATFTGDISAAVTGNALSSNLVSFIGDSGIPCGSSVQLSLRTTTLGIFACRGARGASPEPALCLETSAHTCAAPGGDGSPSGESSFEGSTNGQEGSGAGEESSAN